MIIILCFHLLPIFDPTSDKGTPAKWNHILRSPGGSTYRESTVSKFILANIEASRYFIYIKYSNISFLAKSGMLYY